MIAIKPLSKRRSLAFHKAADYFISQCGWELHQLALGYVMAFAVPQGQATAVSTMLAGDYARWKRSQKK